MDSELRYHATSGEWVLIAPARSDRPHELNKIKAKRVPSPKGKCPFENPQKSGNEIPIFWFLENKPISKWKIQVLPNKYPVLMHRYRTCAATHRDGMYTAVSGVGHHDLLITRDHAKTFSDLSDDDAYEVFRGFHKRYHEIVADGCVKYISMFQNWGTSAGASIFHPHYQIVATPVIPHGVGRSLIFSHSYFAKHHSCIHCAIIRKEIKENKRIVYENKDVIAFIPFAAKEPFQVNIFLKSHRPYFEDTPPLELRAVALALKKVLESIKKKLGDPDYNFFMHTAPAFQKRRHRHYHWHIEVVPKSNISAGFELGTGIELNPMFPEDAAKIIRIKT
jgi:UDPglucose--hexose-1-phosphate uridylyltransferase